jgi:hypothetical protein
MEPMPDLRGIKIGWRPPLAPIKLGWRDGGALGTHFPEPVRHEPLVSGPAIPNPAAPRLRAASGTPIAWSLSLIGGDGTTVVTGQSAQGSGEVVAERCRHG